MKKKQLPLMIMTTLLLGIHSFATVEAAQVVGKWGTKTCCGKIINNGVGKNSCKSCAWNDW